MNDAPVIAAGRNKLRMVNAHAEMTKLAQGN
jgi:hypothetical protein